MSKSSPGSLFLDYVILFSLFLVVLAACLFWRLSPETSEVLAFSTLFGFLLSRRALKRNRKTSRKSSPVMNTEIRPVRVRVRKNGLVAT